MAKKAGYVYQRPGRAAAQVTTGGVRQTPESYAKYAKTPELRAEGKFMLDARSKGWDVEPSELGTGDHTYGRGNSIDMEISVSRGAATGTLVSRLRADRVGNERDARIRFDPRRGIPTPAQVRSAFERRKQRVRGGAEASNPLNATVNGV